MATNFFRQSTSDTWVVCLVFTTALIGGCGTSNKPILAPKVQNASDQSDEVRPMVVHPEYANWSRFPVGAQVVRYRVVSNEKGKVEVTSTIKLEQKTDRFVEIVSQVNVKRSDEDLQENPPERTKFLSEFKLPAGLSEDFFQLPSSKAKMVGEEELQVHGRSVQAKVYEWTENNETGPMAVKLWRSDQVPGRIVRQEMFIESSQTKTVEELLEVTWE